MVMLYLSCELRNDFYLLHAITATWALGQMLSLFAGKSVKRRVRSGQAQVEGGSGGSRTESGSSEDAHEEIR